MLQHRVGAYVFESDIIFARYVWTVTVNEALNKLSILLIGKAILSTVSPTGMDELANL